MSWTVIFDVESWNRNHQGKGCGRAIVESLVQQAGATNVLLHSVLQASRGILRRDGVSQLRTAMARFPNNERAARAGIS